MQNNELQRRKLENNDIDEAAFKATMKQLHTEYQQENVSDG
jgi:hypothetical protein